MMALRPKSWLRWLCVLLALYCLACAPARADSCTVTMSDVVFGDINSIAGVDYTATGSGSVTCSWTLLSPTPPFVLLFPNVVVCVNAGLGTNSLSYGGRQLGQAAQRIDYNLYTASSYASATTWGATGQAGTVPINLSGGVLPLVGGSIVRPFTVYAKLPASASLTAAKVVGNGPTSFSSAFTGAGSISYAFYNLTAPACTAGGSVAFSFNVTANLTNNCTISANPLAFLNAGALTSAKRTTTALSVRCTNDNAWRIALDGGTVAANVAARKMKDTAGTDTISYRISDTLDGPLWGDGNAGTSVVTGTGTGAAQTVTLYGLVPVQTTPRPGDYKDSVTATIYF
ncbi:Csu type fimbrial protein [Pseudoduganella aquatica]|uniref:Fimbrial major subunit CsuA/B family protein n=1 Tax=Pseudoduganella aquatica TaxID=2660641 RepID=A0A7X4KQB6_9BURK|nr:spore coat U domain-containing protein [Pseudoduganella aquatica]MYN11082.1 fimbrial major subunit CsuA/B family protein [Pseudoduganella aquatica]